MMGEQTCREDNCDRMLEVPDDFSGYVVCESCENKNQGVLK